MKSFDDLVGQIDDCAINPDLWTPTLIDIRDTLGTAYVLISYAKSSRSGFGQPAHEIFRYSPWEASWFQRLGARPLYAAR